MRRGLLIIAASLLAGCAAVESGVRNDTAPGWTEVRTEHLHLWVELDAASATGLARSVEAVRAALGAFWTPQLDPVDRLEVVVFADHGSLTPYTFSPGGYVVDGLAGPILVIAANGVGGRAIASHELSHHLIAQSLRRQPRWLAEGLATYLETAIPDPAGASVTFGRPPAGVSPADLVANPLTLSQLWGWSVIELTPKDSTSYYANAWWVVHHLIDARGPQFNTFLGLLAAGGEPKAAWAQAFAGVTDVELEAELATALAQHQLTNPSKPLLLKPCEATTAPVSWAALYALKAELLSRTTVPLAKDEWQRQIEDQLESALVLDDANERALVLKSTLIRDDKARVEFLRATVLKLPQSARAYAELGAALARIGKDPTSSFDKAIALAPEDPLVLNGAALQALFRGETPRALELSERAATLRPYSAIIVDTYAGALAAAGRCSEAVDRARQAVDLLGHASRSRPLFVSRLHRYERECTSQRPVLPTREQATQANLP